MPGLKCKRVKPHFVQRGERCQVVSSTLQDLCLCGLLPHSVPPHLHLHINRCHTLLMGDAKCSESMSYLTGHCSLFYTVHSVQCRLHTHIGHVSLSYLQEMTMVESALVTSATLLYI